MEKHIYRPIDEFLNNFVMTDEEKDVAEYMIQSMLKGYQISWEMGVSKAVYQRHSGNVLAATGTESRLELIVSYCNFVEDKFYLFEGGKERMKYHTAN